MSKRGNGVGSCGAGSGESSKTGGSTRLGSGGGAPHPRVHATATIIDLRIAASTSGVRAEVVVEGSALLLGQRNLDCVGRQV